MQSKWKGQLKIIGLSKGEDGVPGRHYGAAFAHKLS